MMLTFLDDAKQRKRLLTEESTKHPAKMNLGMLLWVIGKYTKPGDTILDPMAGSGRTMLAARYGRNVILVELEEKFALLAQGNWEKMCSLPQLKWGLGDCQIFRGDARDLTGILADAVVTSPPYEATFNEKQHTLSGIAKRDPSMRTEVGGYSGGADTVITSPPYGDISMGGGLNTKPPREGCNDQTGRSMASPSQLGAGRYTDIVVSSPPYEGALQGDVEDKISSGFSSPAAVKMLNSLPRGYSKAAGNIGNLRREKYLEAMRLVYQQCYQVIKPGGLMVLVTKDYIRKKHRVLLSIDTIRLCESIGFMCEDWHERRITKPSFWRRNYAMKYPEAPTIDTEDILVFRKPS